MVRMPREGLSETGQIIAAVATAIILALLAKYGFLPDEDGDDNGGGGKNGKTVINIQIGGERLEDVARAGRDAMTPHKGTPPRIDESGVHIPDEPFEDLTVGALPIKNRVKPIMPDILEHIGADPHTMPLVVLLDRVYGTQSQISVYSEGYDSEGYDGWSRLGVKELGVYESQLHFLVDVPVNWDAKDASGRVRQLMVLCRTDDATKVPDHVICANYLARARADASEEYFLKANKDVNLFGTTKGTKYGAASLSTIQRGVVSLYVPAIYIPKGTINILPI